MLLSEILNEIELPEGVVTVLPGDGAASHSPDPPRRDDPLQR
jgi:hypothetical protein